MGLIQDSEYVDAFLTVKEITLQTSPLEFLSCVCMVAQYAVLEANGKVNGIGENSNPSPSQTLGPAAILKFENRDISIML